MKLEIRVRRRLLEGFAQPVGHNLVFFAGVLQPDADGSRILGRRLIAVGIHPLEPPLMLDGGIGEDGLLEAVDDAVGGGQRCPRRQLVDDLELALVEPGEEIALELEEQGAGGREHAEGGQIDHAPAAQRPGQQPDIDRLDRAQPMRAGLLRPPQHVGQDRRHAEGEQDRDDEGDAQRDRQRPEEEAGNPREQGERKEDHDIGHRRSDQRPGDPAGGAPDGDLARNPRVVGQLAGDGFDDDDDLVDDQSDGDGQTTQAHQAQGHSGPLDDQDRDGHGHGDDRGRHQGDAEAAQEDIDHDQRQQGADQDGIAERFLGGADEPRLVPITGHLHIGNALGQGRDARIQVVAQADGIGADDGIGAEQHGMLAVEGGLLGRRPVAQSDLAELAERHGRIAAVVGDGDIGEGPGIGQRLAGEDDAALIGMVDGAGGMGRVRLGQGPRHLADAGARGGQGLRIEGDPVFQAGPGKDGDPAQPRRAGEDRDGALLDQIAQLRLAQRRGGDRVGGDRLHIGMLDDGLDAGDGGEAGTNGGDHRLDVLQIGMGVARGIEVELDLHRALIGEGAGLDHGQRLQGGLQRTGDRRMHLLRRQVARPDEDLDAGEGDLGKDAFRGLEISPDAEEGEHQDQEQHRLAVALRRQPDGQMRARFALGFHHPRSPPIGPPHGPNKRSS